MRALRLLLFSDELSLMDDAAREQLKGYEYRVFDETDATHAGAARQLAHGLEIDIVSVDELEGSIERRDAMGRDYDAYALYSLRVWRLGASLLSCAKRIREHPGVARSGLRLSCLPIAVMNPLDLLDQVDPRSKEINELRGMSHVSVTRRGETFADSVARVVAGWHADLLSQLEYLGYAIVLDERGKWRVDVAFERPDGQSAFFGAPPELKTLATRSVFRVNRDMSAISRALKSLEEALNDAERLDPRRREPRMQRCLEENPELLTQGLFEHFWAEPSLENADPLKRGIRPDFVVAGDEDWEHVVHPRVYEIKSPEFRATVARKASEELRLALEQLGDRYRSYFEDPRNQSAQQDELGRVISHPRLMLVIGRDRWLQDWIDLEEMQQQSEHSRLGIVSYDELGAMSARRLSLLRRIDQRPRHL
ncbi:MAG: DUF4263 domain-containing protein [bacterium]|nr:DUF4263 domain-containing protein [bacterium]